MKTRAIAKEKSLPELRNGLWLLPLLLTLLAFTPGCAKLRDTFLEKPSSEIVMQAPPSYGTVTTVGAAAMADKEQRWGDLAITIELDDERTIMVIQPEDDIYTPGDRVRVVRDGQGFVRAQLL